MAELQSEAFKTNLHAPAPQHTSYSIELQRWLYKTYARSRKPLSVERVEGPELLAGRASPIGQSSMAARGRQTVQLPSLLGGPVPLVSIRYK